MTRATMGPLRVDLRAIDADPLDRRVVVSDPVTDEHGGRVVVRVVEHTVEVVGGPMSAADAGHHGEASDEREVELLDSGQRRDETFGCGADEVDRGDVTRHGRGAPSPG